MIKEITVISFLFIMGIFMIEGFDIGDASDECEYNEIAQVIDGVWECVPFYPVDQLCIEGGDCAYTNLIISGNLSILGDVLNVTVVNVTINATTITGLNTFIEAFGNNTFLRLDTANDPLVNGLDINVSSNDAFNVFYPDNSYPYFKVDTNSQLVKIRNSDFIVSDDSDATAFQYSIASGEANFEIATSFNNDVFSKDITSSGVICDTSGCILNQSTINANISEIGYARYNDHNIWSASQNYTEKNHIYLVAESDILKTQGARLNFYDDVYSNGDTVGYINYKVSGFSSDALVLQSDENIILNGLSLDFGGNFGTDNNNYLWWGGLGVGGTPQGFYSSYSTSEKWLVFKSANPFGTANDPIGIRFNNNSFDRDFVIRDDQGEDTFYFQGSDGNVGIGGETSPDSPLEVLAESRISSTNSNTNATQIYEILGVGIEDMIVKSYQDSSAITHLIISSADGSNPDIQTEIARFSEGGTTKLSGNLNVSGNINVTGCIIYNGGTLGTCI